MGEEWTNGKSFHSNLVSGNCRPHIGEDVPICRYCTNRECGANDLFCGNRPTWGQSDGRCIHFLRRRYLRHFQPRLLFRNRGAIILRQTICSFRTPNYFFKINLNLLSHLAFPPHWRMRLYYQVASRSRLMERLCHLACRDNSRLDICDIERNPKVWVRQSGLGEIHPNGYLVPNMIPHIL